MYFTGRRVGTRMRAVLVAKLYHKSLRRTMSSNSCDEEDGQASLGKIVTLMSVDSERIRSFMSYSHDLVIQQPLGIVIALVGLFAVLGPAAITGIVMILAIGPLGTMLGNLIGRLQEQLMESTDARVNIMNEVLQGIRIVKYFAWYFFYYY
jgi:ABC-type multidrug transport system fused ATPase/permease subunit